jgi:hypothetical protein
LRRLAGQVAELAARPIEARKKELWTRHNALEAVRPLVLLSVLTANYAHTTHGGCRPCRRW